MSELPASVRESADILDSVGDQYCGYRQRLRYRVGGTDSFGAFCGLCELSQVSGVSIFLMQRYSPRFS
jgi:hypothetical protein